LQTSFLGGLILKQKVKKIEVKRLRRWARDCRWNYARWQFQQASDLERERLALSPSPDALIFSQEG
jgi:hypothetical protein